MIHCYADKHKSNSIELLSAFSRGAQANGEKATVVTDMQLRDGPAAFYGVTPDSRKIYEEVVSSGREYYIIDNGYIHSKWHGGTFYRVVKNGRFHSGQGESDGNRFAKLGIKLKPWHQGSQILIALQSDWWYSLNGTNRLAWYNKVRDALKNYGWQGEVVLRDKPQTKKIEPICWPCTYAVVTHSSNVAVDGLLHGIPAFLTAQCAASPVGNMGLSQIMSPSMPDDRERWAGVLADNQWEPSEIQSGLSWRMLNDRE